jgi:lysophospholipase L1-like esterase
MVARYLWRKKQNAWGMMLMNNKIYHFAIIVIFYCLWSLWTIMSLSGCSENIPPASSLVSGKVTLSWNEVSGAISYNVYGSTSPGVTKLSGSKTRNAPNPFTITQLQPGKTYYFVVTVVTDSGESKESREISYTAIANTEGSIQFGDIVSHSDPDAVASELKNIPTTSLSELKPEAKPEQQLGQVASTRSSPEIIICFGDSLTFGTGASKGMDYPSQLAKMIGIAVINKGIPGDTTSSALWRLKRDVLSKNPDIVLITLGGNDLINGVSKDIAFGNLKQIVQSIQKQGAKVIIGGLSWPGMDRGFGEGYEDLAQQTGALLIPDIFTAIADNPVLMSDPIHPNNSGYLIIARRFSNAITSSELKAKPTVKNPIPKTHDVTLTWDEISNATSYNIYWSDKPGVTKKNGTKISNVKSPHKIVGLKRGKKYYFVVTAVNASGESEESKELSFTVEQ